MTMKCPICRRAVAKSDAEFPFCSERCRMEDLGNWVYGRYRIAARLSDAEEMTEQEPGGEDPDENDE